MRRLVPLTGQSHAHGAYPNGWAPVPEHRGARDLRLAKNFWYAPVVFRDLVALGLHALVSQLCSDFRRRKQRLAAAILRNLRRDLACKQGHRFMPGGVILLTECDPTDVKSVFAASRLDHMIQEPLPAKPGAEYSRNFVGCSIKCSSRRAQESRRRAKQIEANLPAWTKFSAPCWLEQPWQ